jgi:hypothetical protein
MSKLNIKNGTPIGNAHLCRNCTWAQIMTGYRESDLLVICTNASPNLVVPFTVMECSEFSDKLRPDWEQMEKLAIDIQPVRLSKKTRGFNFPGPSAPGKEAVREEEGGEAVALAR